MPFKNDGIKSRDEPFNNDRLRIEPGRPQVPWCDSLCRSSLDAWRRSAKTDRISVIASAAPGLLLDAKSATADGITSFCSSRLPGIDKRNVSCLPGNSDICLLWYAELRRSMSSAICSSLSTRGFKRPSIGKRVQKTAVRIPAELRHDLECVNAMPLGHAPPVEQVVTMIDDQLETENVERPTTLGRIGLLHEQVGLLLLKRGHYLTQTISGQKVCAAQGFGHCSIGVSWPLIGQPRF